MLYLLQTLTDKEGARHAMLGLLPGDGFMQQRLARLAMQRLIVPELAHAVGQMRRAPGVTSPPRG